VFVNNSRRLKKYETEYQKFLDSMQDQIASLSKEAVDANKKLWQIKKGR